MKKILVFVWCMCCGIAFGQTGITPDTLVKLGGRKIPAHVKNIGATVVYYSLAEKPKENLKIDRKDLEKVIFRSGRIELFNKPAFQLIAEGQWEAVLVTRDIKETEGLYKRKEISAKSSPSQSKKKAQQNAITKLQKLAANSGGCIVYITDEEFYGGYGDAPGCYIEAVAYGVEPLEEGTDVINKKNDTKNTPDPVKTDTKTSPNPGSTQKSPATNTTSPVNNTKTLDNTKPANKTTITGSAKTAEQKTTSSTSTPSSSTSKPVTKPTSTAKPK